MLKYRKTLLLAALLVLCLVGSGYAVTVATMGAPDSSGNYPIVVDSDNYITYNGGVYAKYELVVTNDTITAAESGKHFIMECVPNTPCSMTLPDADVGLEFTFTQGNVTTTGITSDGAKYFWLRPQSTDLFVLVNSNATNTYVAGDRTYNSNGYTGDSLHIICVEDLFWQVVDKLGTWGDAGAHGTAN